MRKIVLPTVISLVICNACSQFSQQVVGPMPPPSPETYRQPLPPVLEEYYTLPRPLND
ncbi:MAG: hypothetical protein IKA23_05815 [Akkermansia sp.]|nr:hypothetical protein [Akkermansia sp.]MBR2314955.1 hypothetical protein [Akkermansia sp.]